MRRIAQERVSLKKRFPHEIEFPVLQVTQPAVDHARQCRGTAGTKVVSFNQEYAQALHGQFAESTNSIDPAPDYDDIEIGCFAHCRDLALARIGHGVFLGDVELRVVGHVRYPAQRDAGTLQPTPIQFRRMRA